MFRRIGYLLYRWHAWAGLIGGIFLIVICVSGSIAVFKPEIQRAVDWGGYDFDVRPVGEPITPSQALAVVEEKYPRNNPLVLYLPALPGTINSHGPTYGFRLGGSRGNPSRDVLVDPFLGKVVAETRLNDGWGFWLRQLHLRLLYGSYWGRWVVGGFGMVLAFACLSGLFIYTRFNAGRWKPKLRRGRGSRVFWADVHKLVGIAALAFNLLFGGTGAVLGLETLYSRYARAVAAAPDAPRPTTRAATPRPARLKELPSGMLETCIARAKELLPATTPAAVDLLYKRNGTLRVKVEHPSGYLIAEGRSSVTFDARTGEPMRVVDASASPVSERLYLSMEPLHFGRLWGSTVVKLLWGATGLTGGLLSITGYAIYVLRWWKKRASRTAVRAREVALAA